MGNGSQRDAINIDVHTVNACAIVLKTSRATWGSYSTVGRLARSSTRAFDRRSESKSEGDDVEDEDEDEDEEVDPEKDEESVEESDEE